MLGYFSCLLALFVAQVHAEPLPAKLASMKLGKVDFPISTEVVDARDWFQFGLRHLLVFNYGESVPAMQNAKAADPNFALAYAFEAFQHFWPLWRKDDVELGAAALREIPTTATADAREQLYIDAITAHFNVDKKDDEPARLRDTIEVLAKLAEEYEEPTAYAYLGLYKMVLSAADMKQRERLRGESEQALLHALELDPTHPGTNHFLLHFYDQLDPVEAVPGLPIARVFPSLAPDANHAQHMPVHIFHRLGMYEEAYESEMVALEASVKTCEVYGKPADPSCDPIKIPHSLENAMYFGYQLGRLEGPKKNTETMRGGLASATDSKNEKTYGSFGHWLIRMDYREQLEKLLMSPGAPDARGMECTVPPVLANSFLNVFTESGALLTYGMCLVFGGDGQAEDEGAELQRIKLRMVEISAASEVEQTDNTNYYLYQTTVVHRLMLETAELFAAGQQWKDKMTEALEEDQRRITMETSPPVLWFPPAQLQAQLLLGMGDATGAIHSFLAARKYRGNTLHNTLGQTRALARAGCPAEAQAGYAFLLNLVDTKGDGADRLPYGQELKEGAAMEAGGEAGGEHCIGAVICRSRTNALVCNPVVRRRSLLFGSAPYSGEQTDPDCTICG